MTSIHLLLTPDAAGGQVSDPRNRIAGTGAGGSRAGYMGLVAAMGRRGDYDVTAYSTFIKPRDEFEGVTYRRWDDRGDMGKADVILAYYDVRELMRLEHEPKRLNIGSHHTLDPYVAWPRIAVNTAPSQWALDTLRKRRPLDPWELLPNAIEGLDDVVYQPVPGRVIYQTSPDRGLHNLLLMWPEIRRRVPNATLHVTGTPEQMALTYLRSEWAGSTEARIGKKLADGMLAAQEAGGVQFLGRVTRERMLDELRHASVAAYPFEVWAACETFSVSILECHKIGLPVVMAPVDALESIWGDSACITATHDKPEFVESFVSHTVRMLTDSALAAEYSEAGRNKAKPFTFDNAAAALERIIRKHRGGV